MTVPSAGQASFQARVLITGIGVYSPVGYNGPATLAALRAGITRLNKLRDLVDRHGEPLAAARIPGMDFPPGHSDRVVSIAIRVLKEVIAPLTTQEQRLARVSLILGEPQRARPVPSIVERVRSALGEMGLATPVVLDVYPEGNAGGVKALQAVQSRLQHNPASVEIVAGADSLSNVESVAFFEKYHRLRESQQSRGLHLGEAGASLVLRSERALLPNSTLRYAAIEGSGVSMEPVPLWDQDAPKLAIGLTEALVKALEAAGWEGSAARCVFIDLNGEPCRSHEWMLAASRVLDTPIVLHPADCIGDVGAATAPLLLGMAARAIYQGYAKSSQVLVSCASDAGLRGAVCVGPVARGQGRHRGITP